MMFLEGYDDQPPKKVSDNFWGHLRSEDAWGSLVLIPLVHGRVLGMVRLGLIVLLLWFLSVIVPLVGLFVSFSSQSGPLMICFLVEPSVPHLVILDDEISLESSGEAVFQRAIASFVDKSLGLVIDPIIVD